MKPYIRFIASIITFIFTTTSFTYANPSWTRVSIAIPQSDGTVVSRFRPTQIDTHNTPTVILIQDAHTNLAAQEHIIKLIEHLERTYGTRIIATEGTWGEIDNTAYTSFPFKDITTQIINTHLSTGKMGAAEASGILLPSKITIYGTEEKDLFFANYDAFLRNIAERPQIHSEYTSIKEAIDIYRTQHFSKRLREFTTTTMEFHTGKLPYLDYLLTLESEWKKGSCSPIFPSLQQVFDTAALYRSTTISRVTSERSNLITKLLNTSQLTEENRRTLLKIKANVTVSARATEYDTLLINLALTQGVDKLSFIEYSTWVKACSTLASLDSSRILQEAYLYERKIREDLSSTTEEKEISRIELLLVLIERIISLTATREDTDTFFSEQNSQYFTQIAHMVTTYFPHLGFSEHVWAKATHTSELFYSCSQKRDKALLDNTLSLARTHKIALIPLLVGGYHTKGIISEMAAHNIPYVLISPTLEHGPELPYERKMTGELYSIDSAYKHNLTFVAARIKELDAVALETKYPSLTRLAKSIAESLEKETIQELVSAAITQHTSQNGAPHSSTFYTLRTWIADHPRLISAIDISPEDLHSILSQSPDMRGELLHAIDSFARVLGITTPLLITDDELLYIVKSLIDFYTQETQEYTPPSRPTKILEAPSTKISFSEGLLSISLSLACAGLTGSISTGCIVYAMIRTGSLLNTIINECGHLMRAYVLNATLRASVITSANVRGNISAGDWFLLALGFTKNAPYISINSSLLTTDEDMLIRQAGIWASIAACFSFIGLSALCPETLFTPFLIGFGISLIKAYISDVIEKLPIGMFACGNVGVLAVLRSTTDPERTNEVTGILTTIVDKMLQITQSRGEQAVGGVLYTKSKSTAGMEALHYRMVNKKRSYMATVFMERITRMIKHAKPLWNPFVGFAFHVRFGTNRSGPSVIATHPHRGLLSRKLRHWKVDILPDPSGTTHASAKGTIETLENFITHNGDFDGINLYGRERSLGTLRSFLNRIYGTNTTLEADSPHVAWTLDLFHTQGMWEPSLLLGYHKAAYYYLLNSVSDPLDAPYPPLSAFKALGEKLDRVFEKYSTSIFTINPNPPAPVNHAHTFNLTECRPYVSLSYHALVSLQREVRKVIAEDALILQYVHKDFARKLADETIDNFFKMDLYEATKYLMTHAVGSFGLITTSTVLPQTYVLSSYKQPISLGFSRKNNMVTWVSDAQALLAKKNGSALFDSRYDLDMPNGEVVNLTYDTFCNRFKLKSYHLKDQTEKLRTDILKTGRYIKLEENPYISFIDDEIAEVPDPIQKDLDDTSDILRTLHHQCNDTTTFNGKTCANFIRAFNDLVESKKTPPSHETQIGDDKLDIIIIGAETSNQNAARFAHILNEGFGQPLGIKACAVDPEEILQSPADFYDKMHAHTIVLSISQSGQTFPTYFATYFFKQFIPDRIFTLSASLDTPLGQLVQEMYHDAPFSGQIFTNLTGMRRSEAKTIASVANWYLLNELFIRLADEHKDRLEQFSNDIKRGITGKHYDRAKYAKLLDHKALELLKKNQLDTIYTASRIVSDKTIRDKGHVIAQHILENLKGWVASIIFLGLLMAPHIISGFPVLLPHALFDLCAEGIIHGIEALLHISLTGPLTTSALYTISLVGFVIDVLFLTCMHYVMVLGIRYIEGRHLQARNGKRTLVIADNPFVSKLSEYYIRSLFGMSRAQASLDIHSSLNWGQIIHEYHRAVVRGTLVDIGVSDSEPSGTIRSSVQMVINQVQGIANHNHLFRLLSYIFPSIKLYGAEVHTVRHGKKTDIPDGAFDTIIPYRDSIGNSRSEMYWFEELFGSLDRYMERLVKYHTVARDVARVDFFNKNPHSFWSILYRITGAHRFMKKVYGYRFWSSHSGTNVATTATTTSPQNMLNFLEELRKGIQVLPIVEKPKQDITVDKRLSPLFTVERSKSLGMAEGSKSDAFGDITPQTDEKPTPPLRRTWMPKPLRKWLGILCMSIVLIPTSEALIQSPLLHSQFENANSTLMFIQNTLVEKALPTPPLVRGEETPSALSQDTNTIMSTPHVTESPKEVITTKESSPLPTGELPTEVPISADSSREKVLDNSSETEQWIRGSILNRNGAPEQIVARKISHQDSGSLTIGGFMKSMNTSMYRASLDTYTITLPGSDSHSGDSLLELFSKETGITVNPHIFTEWAGDINKLYGVTTLKKYVRFLKKNAHALSKEDRSLLEVKRSRNTTVNLLDLDTITNRDILTWLWNTRIPHDIVRMGKSIEETVPADTFRLREGTLLCLPLTTVTSDTAKTHPVILRSVPNEEISPAAHPKELVTPALSATTATHTKNPPLVPLLFSALCALPIALFGFIRRVSHTPHTAALPTASSKTTQAITVYIDKTELSKFALTDVAVVPNRASDSHIKDALTKVNEKQMIHEQMLLKGLENIKAEIERTYTTARVSFIFTDLATEADIDHLIASHTTRELETIMFVKGQKWNYPETKNYTLSDITVDMRDRVIIEKLRGLYSGHQARVQVMPLYYTDSADVEALITRDTVPLLRFQQCIRPLSDTMASPSFFEELCARITVLAEPSIDSTKESLFFSNTIEESEPMAMPKEIAEVFKNMSILRLIHQAA